MKDFIINLICGSLGGLVVYYIQIANEKKKKKNHIKERIEDSKKIIPQDFIYSIHIGMSMNKIEEIIGLPLFSHTIDENELFGNDLIININEYRFENCFIKIIHQNNQLSAIIISSYNDSKIELIKPDSELEKPIIGKFCVDGTFDNENESNEIIHEISMRDSWFGIIEYHGRFGGYNYYCYYGILQGIDDLENLKIEQFKGQIIEAFGLSSNPELFKYYSSTF
ncbi:hypothetical protein ACNQGP_02910 [Flavobacterium sp. GT2N3]|uniref:hypothetical protein n=1 Tax=unclassified Flavobacterium TaxID=196869 RepID=UPI003AAD460F